MTEETSTQANYIDPRLFDIVWYIRMAFLPVIIVGTITNILNFIVLSNPKMRKLSTSVYLLALTIADTGVMYFELFRIWFEWMGLVPPKAYFSKPYCKFANFTNGFFRDYSNWLIACVAAERLLMVATPYRAKIMCTVKNARITSVLLAVIIVMGHVPCLIFSTYEQQGNRTWVCWEDKDTYKYAGIVTAFFEAIFGYLVVVIVIVLNITLVVVLYKTHYSNLPADWEPSDDQHTRQQGIYLTRTLLLIIVMFLVCEGPRMILSIVRKASVEITILHVFLNMSYLLSGFNHACNFFVYILASPTYQLILFDMTPWCGWQLEQKTDDASAMVGYRCKCSNCICICKRLTCI